MARNYTFCTSVETIEKVPYERLCDAYEVALRMARTIGETVNVWRECLNDPSMEAMVGSVYRNGSIVGITDRETWENVLCDYA